MCGRYASTSSRRDLVAAFDAAETVGEELPPSYNIAPTQRVNVVLERPPRDEPGADPVRQVNSTVKWGLLPDYGSRAFRTSLLYPTRYGRRAWMEILSTG